MVGSGGLRSRLLTVYLPLAGFVVATLFRFYWMLVTSLKPNQEWYNARLCPLIVYSPTLQHYIDLLTQPRFVVAAVTTLISLTLGTMAAYPLARMNFPGAAVVALAIAATYLVPRRCCSFPWPIWSIDSVW